jgi:hypothetical protein
LVERNRSPLRIPVANRILLIGAFVNRLFLRAGIVSVAGIAILGGTVAQAMAAPVNAAAESSATASGSVAREYGGIGFTPEDAIQNARINLAQGSKNLRITCSERSTTAAPFDNTIYADLGNWLGTVRAVCSG